MAAVNTDKPKTKVERASRATETAEERSGRRRKKVALVFSHSIDFWSSFRLALAQADHLKAAFAIVFAEPKDLSSLSLGSLVASPNSLRFLAHQLASALWVAGRAKGSAVRHA